MKIFLFACLIAYALAEPPVGDGYPAGRSGHDHGHGVDSSRSQQYGVPPVGARSFKTSPFSRSQSSTYIPTSRSSLSQQYGVPEFRSSPSQEYGAPDIRTSPSQQYGAPDLRSSLSLEYGVPGLRSSPSQEYGAPNLKSSLSQEYGAPSTRLSQEYGLPNIRNALSSEYTPASYTADFNSPITRLSDQYGAPDFRLDSEAIEDIPSDSYGAPFQRSPSNQYGLPQYRSNPSEEYAAPSRNTFLQSEKSNPSQNYSPVSRQTAPFSRQNSGHIKPNKSSVVTKNFQSSLRSKNAGSPSFKTSRFSSSNVQDAVAVNVDSYSQRTLPISQSYLPSSRGVSQSYGVPKRLSTEYGLSEARVNAKTNAYTSSYDAIRSDPSPKYGVPSTKNAMLSNEYGVPDQYDSLSSQGYNYARNVQDELLNTEPANYDFGYKVNDVESGSDFGHTESRQDNKAEGSYFVLLPDGTKQVVEYEADERGFKPRISVEPADIKSGYDENASDLDRSGDGPY